MADHNKPVLTSTYTNFVSELDARFDDLAVGLDPAVTTATNVPTNALRWNSALNKDQKWNGTAWVDKTATEVFPIVQVNGYMGVGGAGSPLYGLHVVPTALTTASQSGIVSRPVATSAATGSITALVAQAGTAATSFTTGAAYGVLAQDASKGAGSTITNQHGLYVADQTQGTNNYGITSLVSSGTNKWNIYASGTAANLMAGGLIQTGYNVPATGTALVTGYSSGSSAALINAYNYTTPAWVDLKIGALNFTVSTNNTERLRIDSAGNLGLGVTPSAWSGYEKSLQGMGWALTSPGADSAEYACNSYYNAGWKYTGNYAASYYQQQQGAHRWYTAPSGTAGNAITFTERMNLSSTGLAVTGALSSTGDYTQNDGQVIKYGAGSAYIQGSSSATYLNFVTGNSLRAQITNAGLAVTGALSASGTVESTATPFAFKASGASSLNHLFQATNGTQDVRLGIDGSNNCYTGTVSAHDFIVQTAGLTRGVFSSTGLVVTGSVITTGGIKASNTSGFQLDQSGVRSWTISATGGNLSVDAGDALGSVLFNSKATLDAAGNLALGVTPSAWGVSFKSIELASAGLMSNTSGSSMFLMNNAYYNGTNWIYKYTAAASHYDQTAGTHQWYTAPSGTAGNAITFTQSMTLDASGDLLVGSTTSGMTTGTDINLRQSIGDINVNHTSGTASGISYLNFGYAAGVIGSITQNGTTGITFNGGANLNLTGTSVTAPTPATTDDSTKVATTAYVRDNTIGVDQTWQNMAGSRTSGTTYTNSTGKPIQVSVACQATNTIGSVTVGGVSLAGFTNSGGSAPNGNTFIVPTGATYVVTISGGTFSIWSELR